MNMNTFVNFSGKCAEAFRYYEKHLVAKVGVVMTHAQSPSPSRLSSEWRTRCCTRALRFAARTSGQRTFQMPSRCGVRT
jgi:uncharacterized glyoxalase superfamily protein PhnB